MRRFGWLVGSAVSAAERLPTIPTFVLPYKRFAAPFLLEQAQRYLEDSDQTYRTVVRHQRQCIGYPVDSPSDADGSDRSAHQAVIAPSLMWRFLTWLGRLTGSLDTARQMLLASDPNSLCHRISGHVDRQKARSDERLRCLETARQLLQIMPEWEEHFGCKFFPRFATRAGFD